MGRYEWRGTLVAIGIGVFVVVNWWLLRPGSDARTSPAPVADMPFGWYLKGATIIGIGEAGLPVYRLSARLIEQNTADDSAELTGVRVSYDTGSEPPWQLTARGGWIAADGLTIRLSGNVVLTDKPPDGGEPTVLRTEALEVLVDSDIARTDEAVRLENGRNTVTGRGMTAFLRDDRVQLQSDVKGLFQP